MCKWQMVRYLAPPPPLPLGWPRNEGLSGCFYDSLNLVADEFHDTALILTNYPSLSCAFFRVRGVCKQRWTS